MGFKTEKHTPFTFSLAHEIRGYKLNKILTGSNKTFIEQL